MLLRSVLLFATFLAASSLASANVLIVGPQGYATVQDAVNAANDGDVVLVRDTVQGNIVVSKGISVVADVPGHLTVYGYLHIQNLPAGRTVLISGFDVGLTSTTPVVLSQNSGAIRIQDCGILPPVVPFQPALIAFVCTSSSDVALLHSTVSGGSGVNGPDGAAAMSVTDSTLTIDDSRVSGGVGRAGSAGGGSGHPTSGGAGGDGILLSGGNLVLQSSIVHGGAGGDGYDGDCVNLHATAGGAGGKGIVLTAGAVARAIGGRTLGGTGGIGGVNACNQASDGAHGVAADSASGTWTQSPGPSRAFVAPRIVREGEPFQLVFSGAPLERTFLASSSTAARVDSPTLGGVWLLQGPFRRVTYGMLDPLGALTVPQTTPDLPPGVTNDLIHLQPVMVGALGSAHLGCARIVVRLDSSY